MDIEKKILTLKIENNENDKKEIKDSWGAINWQSPKNSLRI